jgi:hypothetical protein
MLTPTALLWTRAGAGALLFLIGTQSYGIWRARRQTGQAWPTVPGTVLESTLERHGISGDRYAAVVRYRYRVGEKDYTSNRIRAGGRQVVPRASAQALADKYPLGARVRVHHDPERPAHAVLEPGRDANMAIMIAVLILFVVIEAVLVSILVNDGELPTTPGGMPWFAYFMPALALVVGVAGFVQYFQTSRLARESEHWPTAAGTIAEAGVTTQVRETEKGNRYEVYCPWVSYSYRVGTSDLRGNAVGWGWIAYYASEESAAAAIARYPQGARVTVYYDPVDPERAVLDPTARSGRAAPLIFGILFGGTGALFLWFMILIG